MLILVISLLKCGALMDISNVKLEKPGHGRSTAKKLKATTSKFMNHQQPPEHKNRHGVTEHTLNALAHVISLASPDLGNDFMRQYNLM